jgi:hypothetical protein
MKASQVRNRAAETGFPKNISDSVEGAIPSDACGVKL